MPFMVAARGLEATPGAEPATTVTVAALEPGLCCCCCCCNICCCCCWMRADAISLLLVRRNAVVAVVTQTPCCYVVYRNRGLFPPSLLKIETEKKDLADFYLLSTKMWCGLDYTWRLGGEILVYLLSPCGFGFGIEHVVEVENKKKQRITTAKLFHCTSQGKCFSLRSPPMFIFSPNTFPPLRAAISKWHTWCCEYVGLRLHFGFRFGGVGGRAQKAFPPPSSVGVGGGMLWLITIA